ncbi:trypsin-1-like isoform X1 [Daphnia pulicaria]|uniref:trypsin-1-like isoform X1 n=1 Tax=Daphnia pulicaria TaxID=35523 RepID=UPI001EEC3A77|nr:trypsin-1-like isoform X1 [Daphnia pulicaria]
MKGLTVSIIWIAVCYAAVAKAQNFLHNSNTDLAAENSCYTTDGEIGKCTSVRSCYPELKLSELRNSKLWAASTRGTCHYVQTNGKQVYGVCCPSQPAASRMQPRNIDSVVIDSLIDRKNEGVSPEAETTMIIMDRQTGCGAGPFRSLNTNEQKIVGGTEAIKNSWPGIVALKNNGRQFCGGSLMSPTHILTAAHCVAHMSSWDVSRLTVELGMHVLKPISDAQVSKKVRRVTRHKGFDSRTLYNDIAILTMESPVLFTSKISPVCLPPAGSTDQYTDKDAAVIGWGALKEGGSQPNALQQVTVQIIANSKCKSSYGSDAPGGIVDHMLCAAYPGKDACSGDSGGPLLVQSSPGSPWIQAGIVSWGIGCAQAKYPGVYTRVTSFMNWIGKNTV